MMISESTIFPSSSIPACATFWRLPSNLNGRVTTATERIPLSLATWATTGAAPVPVPPPMPAVMNSMSAPSIVSAMRSRSSIAASRPISGRAPAPRPRVSVAPNCSCVRAVERFKACASVLAQMKSTPVNPLSIMCSTALPPQPPTPMTLMTAPSSIAWSMISNMMAPVSCLKLLQNETCALSPVSLKIRLKPLLHSFGDAADACHLCARRQRAQILFAPFEQESDGGGIARAFHDVGEAAHVDGNADAYRQMENFFAELGHALQHRRATGQHDSRRQQFLEAAAPQLGEHERVELLDPRLDDFREHRSRQLSRTALTDARHLDDVVGIRELAQRAAVPNLQLLGLLRRRAQRHCDVVRHLIASDWNDRRMTDRAARKHRDVGCSTANVHQAHAEIFLVVVQN